MTEGAETSLARRLVSSSLGSVATSWSLVLLVLCVSSLMGSLVPSKMGLGGITGGGSLHVPSLIPSLVGGIAVGRGLVLLVLYITRLFRRLVGILVGWGFVAVLNITGLVRRLIAIVLIPVVRVSWWAVHRGQEPNMTRTTFPDRTCYKCDMTWYWLGFQRPSCKHTSSCSGGPGSSPPAETRSPRPRSPPRPRPPGRYRSRAPWSGWWLLLSQSYHLNRRSK